MAAERGPEGAESPGPEDMFQRVAVLKRFRELLQAQRDRFRSYLAVLDKQKDRIEQGDTEALTIHVDFAEKIMMDIFSIQKVIDPLEKMYHALYPQTGPERADLAGLKSSLAGLKAEALERARRNMDMLARRMELIRGEIKNLRKIPYHSRPSVYAAPAPALLDIEG
jgi:hypothetical protein